MVAELHSAAMSNVWGSEVPCWISAAGTGGTLVAVVVAIFAFRADRRDRKDARHRQARLIIPEASFPGQVQVRVTNRSDAPIFGIEIESVGVSADPHISFELGQMSAPTLAGPYRRFR